MGCGGGNTVEGALGPLDGEGWKKLGTQLGSDKNTTQGASHASLIEKGQRTTRNLKKIITLRKRRIVEPKCHKKRKAATARNEPRCLPQQFAAEVSFNFV